MLVRVVSIPQEARTVEGMEPSHYEIRRVAEVVQPSGGLKQVGTVAE